MIIQKYLFPLFIISIGMFMCLIKQIQDLHKVLYTLDKEFSEDNGITLNEALILHSLPDKKSSCASYLSTRLGLSNSQTSKILVSLEEKKYIIRRMGKSDRRKMLFSLTDKGREKMEEIQEKENKHIELITRLTKVIEQFVLQ